ncbi:MAG TPA: hypothetical protein VMZ53_18675, partial [Kofleriaceae bacterium]|nr:hypothetical protein [Kofleriaceae bacterium]
MTTPWARPTYEALRAKLASREGERAGITLERAKLDAWLAAAAPPDVPYDAVVLSADALRTRYPDSPLERRSLHMHGKLRMTHRALPSQSVLVLALFSDVAADYFVESMAADVAHHVNDHYGRDLAYADAQANIPIILKEVATAAGLGHIGKNALFFSKRFGFNCKLEVILLDAPVDRYDAVPSANGSLEADDWKLADCASC